jgi:4'-phosphopantetheinyl transferase
MPPIQLPSLFANSNLLAGCVRFGVVSRVDEDHFSAAERARLDRLVMPAARAAQVNAFAGRRLDLGAALGCAPKAVQIGVRGGGAPYLVDRPDLALSIAHSGDAHGFALAAGGALGLDIETVRPVETEGLVRRICDLPDAEDMQRVIAASNDPATFFRLWTAKEAVMKATGLGFQAGAASVHVPVDIVSGAHDSAVAHWRAASFAVSVRQMQGLVIAVATGQSPSISAIDIGSTS